MNKRIRFVVVAIMIFSLVAMYGYVPNVKAASMDTASDTISDSTAGAAATHTIVYNLGTALTAGQYVDVDFETGDFDLSNATGTCPSGTALSTTTDQLTCTGAMSSTSDLTITAINVINPSTASSSYSVTLTSRESGGTEIETIQMKVYIVNNVTISATVNATLSFFVNGVSASTVVNGVTCTENSTATTTPFGTIDDTASSTVCQRLSVTTNAGNGYSVTVEQSSNMVNGSGDTINAFADEVTSTSTVWTAPSGVIGSPDTYGHMGLTSSDGTLDGTNYDGDTNPFASSKYIGLNGTSTRQVLYHTSIANGTTDGEGYADVAYTVEVSALQEAGDYEATLKYIVTAAY